MTALDTEGGSFIDDLKEGDLWYFPAGIPHSIQATNDDPDGTEFLLVKIRIFSFPCAHILTGLS